MLKQPTATEPSPAEPREQIDRAIAFMRRALRFWWVMLIALGVGAVACATFFVVRRPLYRSQTTILYTQGITPVDVAGEPEMVLRDARVRLREMLISRSRLEAVIKEFGLYADIVDKRGIIDAVEEFRKDLEFSAPGSDTYTIGYEGSSPQQAKAVVERLVSALIEQDVNIRKQQASSTRDFLEKERTRADQRLKNAETELARFMADHPGFASDVMVLQTGRGSTAGAAIRATRSTVAETSARGSPASVRYRALAGPASPAAQAAARSVDPAKLTEVRDLEDNRARALAAVAAAQTDLNDKLTRFTERHPDVRAAQANLERAQLRLTALDARVTELRAQAMPVAPSPDLVSSMQPALRRVPLQALPREQAKPHSKEVVDSQQLVKLETGWAQLTREVTEARERYDAVEAGFFKADLAAHSQHGGQGVEVTILDPAFLPLRPVPPGRITWIGIFLLLSVVVGGIFTIAGAAVDDRIYSGRDVALAPLLVEVPRAPKSSRKRR